MRILVADDDPSLRLLMREILQGALGCEVLEASNGEEAWELLDAGTPVDLCIVDMRMHALGGVELVSRLRADERFRQQRILFCSGVNERAPILDAVSAGIDGYLLKPFANDSLQTQVRRILDRPAAPAPLPALAPMREALLRLGTGKETYVRLLKTFTTDVSDTLALVKGNWTTELRREASGRLLVIQGSGATLGADVLVSRAASLEQCVSKNEVAARIAKIAGLEIENRRVIAATERVLTRQEPVPAPPAAEAGLTPHGAVAAEKSPGSALPAIDFLSDRKN